MNDDLDYQKLRETAWRRELTGAEQARLSNWLASHPEARAEWEGETALNELLLRLPESPVPSNFTARVLQAVEREAEAAERKPRPRSLWVWRTFVPRFAAAVVVLAAGVFVYHRHVQSERMELAQSVAAVADVRSLPSPQFLEDFEAIRRLQPAPPADQELLALMK